MLISFRTFCICAVLLLWPHLASAVDYPYKKTKDFRTLASFKSDVEFESSIDQYTQHCLDNTGGGTGGIPCFVAYDLWDRELNTYYNTLMKALGEKERKLLKDSQLAWIKEQEKTIEFNSSLLDLDEEYATTGTMGALLRAGDADRMMTPVVKQRVLVLKEWLLFITHEKSNK